MLVLCSTFFHFISSCSLPLACFSPAPLSHNQFLSSSFFSDTALLAWHILFQSNPVSHVIFPPAVGRGQAQAQCFPRTHLLSPLPSVLTSSLILMAGSCPGQPVFGSPDPGAEMSSVHPQSQQPFLTLVELFLPLGFGGTERRCSKQGCSCTQARAGCWIFWVFSSFPAGTQDHCFAFYKSHWPFSENWGQ